MRTSPLRRSGVDHTANHTTPSSRWRHDWTDSYSTSWWSLLLIYRPREDERLNWPCWLTYSGRFTHINKYPSASGPVQTSESSPIRDRRSTTEPPNLGCTISITVSVVALVVRDVSTLHKRWSKCSRKKFRSVFCQRQGKSIYIFFHFIVYSVYEFILNK